MVKHGIVGGLISTSIFLSATSEAVIVQPALYGVRSFSNELMSFDPTTGVATNIATLNYGGITGMAYDEVSGTLYAASYTVGLLFSIDPSTGATSGIGRLGIEGVSGMTFDRSSGYLYGVDGVADTLVRIDPSNGNTTTIGSMGYRGVYTLAIDTHTDRMYAINNSFGKFLSVDMSTGQASPIADFDRNVGGLTFDPGTGMLIAAFNDSAGDDLYSIDPASGQYTLIGEVGFPRVQALAFVVPAPGVLAMVGTLSLLSLRRRRSRMCQL